MKAINIHVLAVVAFILAIAGCAIHPSNGFYEGSDAIAWLHSIPAGSGGVNYYQPNDKFPFYLRVTFSTTVKGAIYMNIYCPPHVPVFADKTIVVTFENGKRSILEARQSVGIDVSMSDTFTITVPAFNVNGVDFPKLDAAFKWNESKKYYIRGLQ